MNSQGFYRDRSLPYSFADCFILSIKNSMQPPMPRGHSADRALKLLCSTEVYCCLHESVCHNPDIFECAVYAECYNASISPQKYCVPEHKALTCRANGYPHPASFSWKYFDSADTSVGHQIPLSGIKYHNLQCEAKYSHPSCTQHYDVCHVNITVRTFREYSLSRNNLDKLVEVLFCFPVAVYHFWLVNKDEYTAHL